MNWLTNIWNYIYCIFVKCEKIDIPDPYTIELDEEMNYGCCAPSEEEIKERIANLENLFGSTVPEDQKELSEATAIPSEEDSDGDFTAQGRTYYYALENWPMKSWQKFKSKTPAQRLS